MQSADRDIPQAVTGRTNLGVDLQAPLQLHLVKLAKRSLEREIKVYNMLVAATCRNRTRCA